MISKIIPQIFNGDRQLIVSETFSCVPSLGIELHLPVTNEKKSIFKFVFKSAGDQKVRKFNINQVGNDLTFTLSNFLNAQGVSFSDPFNFNIGKDRFFLQLYGVSTGVNHLSLTISVFREKNV